MAIYFGSDEITPGELKLGGDDIAEVYFGGLKIWPTFDWTPAALFDVEGGWWLASPSTVEEVSGYVETFYNQSPFGSKWDMKTTQPQSFVNQVLQSDAHGYFTEAILAAEGLANIYRAQPGLAATTPKDFTIAAYMAEGDPTKVSTSRQPSLIYRDNDVLTPGRSLDIVIPASTDYTTGVEVQFNAVINGQEVPPYPDVFDGLPTTSGKTLIMRHSDNGSNTSAHWARNGQTTQRDVVSGISTTTQFGQWVAYGPGGSSGQKMREMIVLDRYMTDAEHLLLHNYWRAKYP